MSSWWWVAGMAVLLAIAAVVFAAVVLMPPAWLVARRRAALRDWLGLDNATEAELNRAATLRYVGSWTPEDARQRILESRVLHAARAEEVRRIRADAVRQNAAVSRRAAQRRRRRRSR